MGSGEAVVSEIRSGDRALPFAADVAIGRHPASDLVLADARVSSRHAVIEWRDGRWRVRDLSSQNGTTLNGRRVVTWRPLSQGDVLRFAGGEPWALTRLEAAAGAPVASTDEREGAANLEFRWTGAGTGEVRVAGDERVVEAGLPFVMLERLGRAAGDWVSDAELRQVLWGRRASQLSRSALHALVKQARDLLAELGAPAGAVEKGRGRTRLRG